MRLRTQAAIGLGLFAAGAGLAVMLTPRRVEAAGAVLELRPFSSDGFVVREVFVEDVYGLLSIDLPPRSTILDVGGNIGAFSVRCAQLWPDARIIAVEMEPGNAEQFRKNAAGFPQVELVQVALRGDLAPTGRDCPIWNRGACRTTFSETEQVPSLTLRDLLDARGVRRVNLLKMDVEGAEHDILRRALADGTLGSVDRMVGEWHLRGDGGRESVGEILGSAGFHGLTWDTNSTTGGFSAWRTP